MKLYPTEIEAYDEGEDGVFKLKMFDEDVAELTITAVVARDSWPKISAAIQKGLDMMFQPEDSK
jgi:hypothetical protein